MDETYTLKQIAKRFDLSRARIRQIEREALNKLNEYYREHKISSLELGEDYV